jgi:hypothetical protein
MRGFLDVTEILVPRPAIEEANNHLRYVGSSGLEGFSLWAGVRTGSQFSVRTNIVPKQIGHFVGGGVCVSVGPEELHRINLWLYENQMTLIAQLHSHPGEAYHSETDDTFPIATTVGSVSIVVPNFARQSFAFDRCAIYRLSDRNKWDPLAAAEVSSMFKIVD